MTIEQKHTLPGIVAVDKDVMHGTLCFANTRVPVKTLIDFLETGESINDFLAVYSYIPRQQVLSFLELSRDITIDQITCASLWTPVLIHALSNASPHLRCHRN
jgi:uncharacterized protein (DUF433 family)